MTVLAIVVPSLALVASAAITAYFTNRTHKVVQDVKTQVTTLNGKTMAVIAEEGEERRLEGDPQH
jgi:hypothetical protein